MSKAVRTTLSLVVSLLLFSVVALAQAGGHKQKDINTNHKAPHSRFSKLAFWRHHKNNDKDAKQDQAKPAQSKQSQPRAALVKPSPAKPAAGKSKKDQKQELHAGNMSKTPAQKASAANRTKPQKKAQDRTTASLKE
jgi:hypothetical protein